MTADLPEDVQAFVNAPAPTTVPLFCQAFGCPHGATGDKRETSWSPLAIVRIFLNTGPESTKSYGWLQRNIVYLDLCSFHAKMISPVYNKRYSTTKSEEGDWEWISG